ncbi:VOC family protein [Pontibacter sp. G13]|uniref:bleomycin resistance protein n=1 Tax=Pontibacter sp. G13 TaxID=3074898 RepID=UPI002889EF2B|nr:VOC family protein [Pontibacter sp. G13]WNJ17352.1 VOC family protein [Pontibacter sp. G13]
MATPREQFSHFASILPVHDMQRSIGFYRDQLGFSVEFEWENPPSYVVLRRGEVSIHLSLREDLEEIPGALIYIFVHDVDEVLKAYLACGGAVMEAIGDRDYQMRDFDIRDPDGHRITIGMGLEQ